MKFLSILAAAAVSATLCTGAYADGDHCPPKHVREHQARLHDALKLSAAQEPAWVKFTEATQGLACPGQEDTVPMDQLTTPERLARLVQFNEAMHARLVTRAAAMKDFYAALTPEQQKVLDGEPLKPRAPLPARKGPKGKPEHCDHKGHPAH